MDPIAAALFAAVSVGYSAFLLNWKAKRSPLALLRQVFDRVDKQHTGSLLGGGVADGKISRKELVAAIRADEEVAKLFGVERAAVGTAEGWEKLGKLFHELDKDGSNDIDWDEFRAAFASVFGA